MNIDAELLAEDLAKILTNKVAENTKIETCFIGGKIIAKVEVNKDYLRGIQDMIQALSEVDVQLID